MALFAPVAVAANARPARASGVQIVRIDTHGFDWGDAGIGAAAGIGISMLAVGGGLILAGARRARSQQQRLTQREHR
jgi:hypothetical protein